MMKAKTTHKHKQWCNMSLSMDPCLERTESSYNKLRSVEVDIGIEHRSESSKPKTLGDKKSTAGEWRLKKLSRLLRKREQRKWSKVGQHLCNKRVRPQAFSSR